MQKRLLMQVGAILHAHLYLSYCLVRANFICVMLSANLHLTLLYYFVCASFFMPCTVNGLTACTCVAFIVPHRQYKVLPLLAVSKEQVEERIIIQSLSLYTKLYTQNYTTV